MSGLITGEAKALAKRGISEETCKKFGYLVGKLSGKTVQLAPYHRDGKLVAQHYRTADKDFGWIGDSKEVELFGQNVWRDKGKMVVITEGEIDAMTVSQLQDNRWPVVSLPNGAQSAKKALARALPWLDGFESVILMFDMDAPGRAAVEECVPLFKPGKCKVANLPLKDANEMLLAGRGAEVIDAIWGAKVYRPDGIVTMADIRSKVLEAPVIGLPWWLDSLTAATYGRRLGEAVAFGAGTGIGKTDFLTQQIAYDRSVLKEKVGLFFLEQQPPETAKRIAGKVAKKRFHVPDGGWTQADLIAALDSVGDDGLFYYDHFGACEWSYIRDRMRFLHHTEGVRLFYLDHLTALAAAEDDERRALEQIMAEIGGLVKELNVWLGLVSHLATPEGKPHEEGGRVTIRHFKGSRAIGYWCHYMIGFERDQQSDDPKLRSITTLRVLKDRYTGQATGLTLFLGYDAETGMLFETEAPEAGAQFTDETNDKEF